MQYRVNIIESEAGWGQRIDETKYFDTEAEATKFVKRYNSHNNKKEVPAWYMYAENPIPVRGRRRQVR